MARRFDHIDYLYMTLIALLVAGTILYGLVLTAEIITLKENQ